MEHRSCQSCSEPLEDDALSCPRCGLPVEPEKAKRVGPIISLLGALFVVVGPFLPWLVYGVETTSGVAETRKKALIFVGLGVFAAMFSLSAMTGKKFTGLRGNIINGLVGTALASYFYYELSVLVDGADGSPLFGSGIYFVLVGAILVLAGGILTRSRK